MNIQGYGTGSFTDIMNSSHKRNQIPLVNQIVSYKDTKDSEIYRAYFTNDKVTSHNAVGQKAWETAINDASHAQQIKESLGGITLYRQEANDMSISVIGTTYSYIYNFETSDNGRAIGVTTVGNFSYLDDIDQSNNKGMSSFSKLRSYAEIAEMNGLCEGITDVNSFYDKTQNWEEIMCAVKEVFIGNPQTYEQALNCDKLIDRLN